MAAWATQLNVSEKPKEKIPEHKCCHNGQCCGTENCCDDKGCKSAKCPAIKGNEKDKDKKTSTLLTTCPH